MKFNRCIYVACVSGATAATIFLPGAFASSSARVELRGTVPLVCNVGLNPGSGVIDETGLADLGTTSEFCNNADGYRLLARATGPVAGAAIVVDGRRFLLSPGVEFEVAISPNPARTGRSVMFDAGSSNGGGSLDLRIEAR
jgi:hypothetical protein